MDLTLLFFYYFMAPDASEIKGQITKSALDLGTDILIVVALFLGFGLVALAWYVYSKWRDRNQITY